MTASNQQPCRDSDRFSGEHAGQLFSRVADDARAREELVELHRPLADFLARRFQGRGEPLDDLKQVAYLGLIKAIDRFDLDREVKFSTYASATIVGELKRHFRDRGWALHVPRRVKEAAALVLSAISFLSQDLGRSPTIREITQRCGLSEEEVLEGIDASQAYSTTSLDAPAEDQAAPPPAALGALDESLELVESRTSVIHLLEKLPERERRILFLRFFQERTQTQIAREMGISQMQVSRILARILGTLREQVAKATSDPP
ncbi:MAG: SigB/SigF/SigG family RNA polymerase sigma factor [Actinomycetota bacterium]